MRTVPQAYAALQPASRPSTRAFTLIEIMVAITIFGFVLISIYSSWTAILRSSRIGLDGAAEAQRTRITLRALRESLSSAILYSGNVEHYAFLTDTSGDFAALSFVAQLPSSFPGSGLFSAHTVRRVTFNVEQGPGGQNQLVLRQSPILEPADADPYRIVLSPQVRRFRLQFLDIETMEWMDEWLPTNQLPKIVRVSLSLGKPADGIAPEEDVAHQTIWVSSLAIPRQIQVPPIRRGGLPNLPPGTPPGQPPGGVPNPNPNPVPPPPGG